MRNARGVVGTTTRMDTHTEVPTRVNKLLALPDMPLRNALSSQGQVKQSYITKASFKGGGKQEEAQVAIISRESNAGASTACTMALYVMR